MKKIILALTAAAFFAACSKQGNSVDQSSQASQVQFSYELVETSLKKGFNLADADSIRFSVDSADGSTIFTDTVLPIIIQLQNLTQPLVLLAGDYQVTKYEVLDGDSVIARTPDTSSARDSLGQLVARGLPLDFTVVEDSVSLVAPQVLSALEHNPEDFGSPYYGLDTIPTFFYDFAVSYFDSTVSEERFRYTSGHIDVKLLDDPSSAVVIDGNIADTSASKFYRYSFGDTVSTVRLIDHDGLLYALAVYDTSKAFLDTLRDTLTTAEIKAHEEAPGYKPDNHVLLRN
jgi:hypothetical protein